jgi:hypothetical protein
MRPAPTTTNTTPPNGGWGARAPPRWLRYDVEVLRCSDCGDTKSTRGMRAICLATGAAKFSSNTCPRNVERTDESEQIGTCGCRTAVLFCRVCGNNIGYHVEIPCGACLSRNHNHQRYIFHPDAVVASPAITAAGTKQTWGDIMERPAPLHCIGR